MTWQTTAWPTTRGFPAASRVTPVRTAERTCRFTTLLVVVIAGCAINPVTRRPEVALVSVAKEKQIGERTAKDVERSMGLLPPSALVTYVEAVGYRLAEA